MLSNSGNTKIIVLRSILYRNYSHRFNGNIRYSRVYSTLLENNNPISFFNPDIPKPKAVKLFKNSLLMSLQNKQNSTIDPKLEKVITKLSLNRFPHNLKRQHTLNELYTLIIQRRITDSEIYKAILTVSSNEKIVNVKFPSTIKAIDNSSNNKVRDIIIPNKISPQNNNDLNNILKQIQEQSGTHTNELYQLITNLIEESNEFQQFNSVDRNNIKQKDRIAVNSINIKTLENYLHNIETKQKLKRTVIREQKKIYDWNHSEEVPLVYTGGQLLFRGLESRPLFKSKSWKDSYIGIKSKFIKSKCAESSRYLVLNLADNIESIKTKDNGDRTLFNIRNRDLLGIVNSTTHLPEDTLKSIKRVQSNGWTLIGNLYENPEIVVFQNLEILQSRVNRINFRNIFLLLGGSLISAIIYSNVSKLFNDNDKLDNNNSDGEHQKDNF